MATVIRQVIRPPRGDARSMGEADRMDVDDQVTGDRMKSAAAALILFLSAGIVAVLAPSFRDLVHKILSRHE